MKRVLLATTALVAAGLLVGNVAYAEDEMAGPVTVGLSGHMVAFVGFASNDRDPEGNPLRSEEVFHDMKFVVSGSTTLDNGLTVSAHTSLGGSGAPFAEQHFTLSGSFGSLRIGRTESAAANATIFAPGGGVGYAGVNYPYFSPAAKAVNTVTGVGIEDEQKVVYTSPNFNGLTIGLSYAPEASTADHPGTGRRTDNPANDKGKFQMSEHMAVGVSYSTDFMEDGSLSLGMGYETATNEGVGANPEGLKFGAVISAGQFSFGGGMLDQTDGNNPGMQYDIGASWSEGPLSLGLQYGHSENNADSGETGMTAFHVNYTLGPGIAVGGQLAAGSSDNMEDVTQVLIGTAIFF